MQRRPFFSSGMAITALVLICNACDCGGSTVTINDVDGGVTGDGGPRIDAGRLGGGAGGGLGGGSGGGGGGFTLDAGNCDVIIATVRDFKDTHPDFEHFNDMLAGLVKNDLDPIEHKPVYAHPGPTICTSGPEAFHQWYRDDAGSDINLAFSVSLPLSPSDAGTFVYDSAAFFPLDNRGFGNQGRPHNFHFTTEIHTSFTYFGGEKFTFRGDDDVWVFINRKLALDLGGLHSALRGDIDFDAKASALGIVKGGTYAFDVFHAERHTNASNFRVETTIGCFLGEIN